MNKKISVVLIDDHDLVREGTRQYLERSDRIVVVGQANSGVSAQAVLLAHTPDVAVVDIKMPDQTGIELSAWMREHCPDTRIIMLSAYDDDPYIVAALAAGASGYLLKNTSPVQLIRAVETVAEGGSALDPALTAKVMGLVAGGTKSDTNAAADLPEALSARELEVLTLTSKGMTNKEIGVQLSISNRTVQGHLRKIFSKLDVNSRTEAVTKAIALNLMDVGNAQVE